MAPDPTPDPMGQARETTEAQMSRAGAARATASLTYTDTDPSYITSMEHFEGVDYHDILAGVQQMVPHELHDAAKKWNDVAGAIGGAVMGLNMSLQHDHSVLQGRIATAALEATNTFIAQSNAVQDVVLGVSARISSTGHASEALRIAIHPPATAPATDMTGLALPAPAATVPAQVDPQTVQAAVATMNNIYKPIFQPAGDNVPTFAPVTGPGDPGSTVPGGPGSTTTTDTAQTPGDRNPDGSDPNDPAKNSTTDTGTNPQTTTGPSGPQPQSTNPGDTTSPVGTTPAGTLPAGFTPGDPSAPGGPSIPGSPGGPGSISPGTPGGPGSAVPGGPGSTVPGGPGATTVAGAPAAARLVPGAAGMPGTGAAGGRGDKEEDGEHRTPDYLVIDRTDELIGDLGPYTPQALGADFPAANIAEPQRDPRL